MGFKQIELVPPQVSPLQPTGKAPQYKVFQVSRTDTVSSVKAMLPAQASIISFVLYGSVASNAATTASVTITVTDNSGTVSTGAYDVKTSGAVTGFVQMSALPNIEPLPQNGDLKINVVYAETGTASTLGGPWKVAVEYVA